MCTLYERISELCKKKGTTPSRMCLDLGMSKSTVSDLKSGRKTGISAVTAQKIASYFGVSVGYLLGEETEKAPDNEVERQNKGDEIMFALSRGGEVEITEAMFEEVKNFASFIGHREASKNSKQDRSDD